MTGVRESGDLLDAVLFGTRSHREEGTSARERAGERAARAALAAAVESELRPEEIGRTLLEAADRLRDIGHALTVGARRTLDAQVARETVARAAVTRAASVAELRKASSSEPEEEAPRRRRQFKGKVSDATPRVLAALKSRKGPLSEPDAAIMVYGFSSRENVRKARKLLLRLKGQGVVVEGPAGSWSLVDKEERPTGGTGSTSRPVARRSEARALALELLRARAKTGASATLDEVAGYVYGRADRKTKNRAGTLLYNLAREGKVKSLGGGSWVYREG